MLSWSGLKISSYKNCSSSDNLNLLNFTLFTFFVPFFLIIPWFKDFLEFLIVFELTLVTNLVEFKLLEWLKLLCNTVDNINNTILNYAIYFLYLV